MNTNRVFGGLVVVVAVLTTVGLSLGSRAFRHGLDHTAPVAEWGVAVGTIVLAAATYQVARRAHEEATQVGRQVALETEQLVNAQRPLILPVSAFDNLPGTGMPHVSLSNAGPGAAMNVRGFLWWSGTAGGAAALHPQVLGPGDEAAARVIAEGAVVNWANAVGFLRYHDVSGREWQTHFRFRYDGAGNLRVEVLAVGLTSDFGEPGYNSDGWINKPPGVRLWQISS